MAETLSNSMGDFIARFIKRLGQDPTFQGRPPEEIEAEALRRVKAEMQARSDAKNREINQKRIRQAEEWSRKAKSADGQDQQNAQEEAARGKYDDRLTFKTAKDHQAQVELILDVTAPEWLKADSLVESPQSVELVARITQLPTELQDNPDVLYAELGKFYSSCDWASMTKEARREARKTMDRVFKHIREVSDDPGHQREVLLEGLDHNVERIHLESVLDEDIVSAGEAPKKDVPQGRGTRKIIDKESTEYKDWVVQKVAEQQAGRLQHVVETYQQILDLPENQAPENQREQLEKLIMDLRNGANRSQRIRDVDGDFSQFNREEAVRYIESAQARINKLDRVVDALKEQKHFRQQIESGQLIEWDQQLKDLYPDNPRQVGELATFRVGRISQEDVKLILRGGVEGQKKWLSEFRERFMTAASEPFKENLEISMQFEEFMQLVAWANGEKHHYITQRFRDHWALFTDMDQIIKSTTYRPKGQKAEESFNVLRYFTPKHHEMLRGYDLLDMAKAHYTESLEDIMELETVEYFENLEYLQAQTTHDGEPMRQVDKLLALRKQYVSQTGQYGGLDEALYNEMQDLEMRFDRVGRGVLLRDYHMTANIVTYDALHAAYDEYGRLMRDPHVTTDPDLIDKVTKLKETMAHAWFEVTRNPHSTFNPDDPQAYKELRAIKNLSPIEIRARDRIIQTLRQNEMARLGARFSEEEFQKLIYDDSWKIRDALWAANSISIGTGEAMEKGAKMGRGSMFDIMYTLNVPKEVKTKHFMDRGFAEAYQRVLNPYIFADDFHMGGSLGEVARDLFFDAAFKLHGYDFLKDKSVPQEWKELYRESGSRTKKGSLPRWVVYVQYAQKVLGISYSESLRPDLLATGLQTLSTTWRAERSILEPIQADYQRRKGALGANTSPEYYGLGYQLAGLPDGEKGIAGRKQILTRMMERKPSVFIKLLGNELKDVLKADGAFTGFTLGSKEWRQFQDTLSLIEMQLWRDSKLEYQPHNLLNKADFLRLAEAPVRAVNTGLTTPADVGARAEFYYEALMKVHDYMYSRADNGKTRMDNWVGHKFKNLLVLTSSDFNWQKTDFSKLGLYATERRINDFQAQGRADGLWREILFTSEILSPAPGKETDTITKVKELHNAIVDYAGKDTAETAATAVIDTIINFNRNRSISVGQDGFRGVLGWMPGAITAMKKAHAIGHAFEVNIEKLPGPMKHSVEHFLEDHNLAGVPLNKWPRSVADAVSLANGFGGEESNAWDEYKIAGFLAGVESSMIYTEEPIQLARLSDRFGATLMSRILTIPRKYWWVVPTATIALATMQAIEGEEKKGHH